MQKQGFDAETQSDDAEIDLREYLGIIIDGWRWIALAAFIGFILAAYYAWRQPPVYSADSLMQVEVSKNMAPTAFMGGEGSGQTQALVSAEAAIIKSRSVIGKAVQSRHLNVSVSPVYFPILGEAIARFRSAHFDGVWAPPFGNSYAWGNEKANVTRVELPPSVTSASFILVAGESGAYSLRTQDGHNFLKGHVGRTESAVMPGTGSISIFVKTLKALSGTEFGVRAMSMPAAIGSLRGRLNVSEKPAGSGLLDLTMLAPAPNVAELQLNAIMSAYLEQSVERQSEQAQRRLTFLQKQLPQLKKERDDAQAKLADYQSKTGTLDLSAQASAVLNQLTNLDQQIATVDLDRQQLLQEYTSNAPQVQAANNKKSALISRREKLQAQLKTLPKNESKFLELRRNVEVNDQLYTAMLNTAQGLQVSKAGITGITHIIDEAYSGGGAVAPNRQIICLVGLFAGLFVGLLFVLAWALLRRTIDDPDVIERDYGLPVYATVPFSSVEAGHASNSERRAHLLAVDNPEDTAVESLRSFRTSLQFALIEGGTKCIGITGPTPACGKSFIAANVSTLLAQAGKRVLLVDGDLRRGMLYKAFGVEQSSGLSDVLSGHMSAAEATKRSGVDGLELITTGKRPPNPAELLLTQRFADLKTEVDGDYDYVLFDLPPLLNVTDASIVASHLAATFLVVRSDHSTSSEVQQSIKRMNRDGLRLNGAIFNGLRLDRHRHGYGKYGYYSYKY